MRISKRALPWLLLSALCAVGVSTLACLGDEPGTEVENFTGGNSVYGYFLAHPAIWGASGAPINIPVGARYTLRILDWEDINAHGAANISEVASADESILKVVSVNGDVVVLEALAPGESQLRFKGTYDGVTIQEAFHVSIAAPTQVSFDAPCGAIALVAGHENNISHVFYNQAGATFYGHGLDYLSLDQAYGQVLLDQGTERLQVVRLAADAPAVVPMTVPFDSPARPMNVVQPGKIVKLELKRLYEALPTMQHPVYSDMVAVVTMADGVETCPRLRYTVVSKTPKVCAVEDLTGASAQGQTTTLERLRLVTVAAGKCALALTLAQGQGFEADGELPVEITIEEPPPREIVYPSSGGSGGGSDYDYD